MLDCVKIKKYIFIYLLSAHKLWYMLLGTEFVFLSYEGWNFNSGNYLFTTDTK